MIKALVKSEFDRLVKRQPRRREGLFEELFQIGGIHCDFGVQRNGQRHLEAVFGGTQIRLAGH